MDKNQKNKDANQATEIAAAGVPRHHKNYVYDANQRFGGAVRPNTLLPAGANSESISSLEICPSNKIQK